jgi:hypothetical protein
MCSGAELMEKDTPGHRPIAVRGRGVLPKNMYYIEYNPKNLCVLKDFFLMCSAVELMEEDAPGRRPVAVRGRGVLP